MTTHAIDGTNGSEPTYLAVEENGAAEKLRDAKVSTETAKPGESEARMVAEEALHRETSPNLKALGRKDKVAQEIKKMIDAKKPLEPFLPILNKSLALYLNLLQEELDDCKKEGINLKDFAEEVRARLEAKEKTPPVKETIKNAVFQSYEMINLNLFLHSISMKTPPFLSLNSFSPPIYTHPYLQLYELEKNNDFFALGTKLLDLEMAALQSILGSLLDAKLKELKSRDIFFRENPTLEIFYNGAYIDGIAKILEYAEKKQETDRIDRITNDILLKRIFFPPILEYIENKNSNTIQRFFPYIVKYASLEEIQPYFDKRYEMLEASERQLKWVELHIDAFHLLENSAPEKAFVYALKGKELLKELDPTDTKVQELKQEVEKLQATFA